MVVYMIGVGILIISILITIHSGITLIWMLYAWEDPKNAKKHRAPKKYKRAKYSFTALIPARNEELVIADTIKAVDRIDYPERLKETLILCRKDDIGTIKKAREVIKAIGKKNIRLITFGGYPINKPKALNVGLRYSKKEIVAVFDAEDEPHQDIYKIVNTVMVIKKPEIVQGGVQLMNYLTNWFSVLNVLEYYFWFKSGLNFFSRVGKVSPLGGNTVFFKKEWLKKAGGWKENCLTEDAEVGIRLAIHGARAEIIYDEKFVTKEETPADAGGFIKQRTRWNQGFIQILLMGGWKNLPTFRQKITALYVLLSPIIQSLLTIYLAIAVWVAFKYKLAVSISMSSYIPLYLMVLQMMVTILGMHEFTKSYKLKFPFWLPLKILVVYIPYQMMLTIGAYRAIYRTILSKGGWEKTNHQNIHRKYVLPKNNI